MTIGPNRQSDQRLLDGVLDYVARHENPEVRRFQAAVAGWGDVWSGVQPCHLPAADTLSRALGHTRPETHELAALFEQEKAWRKWEQSYTREDGLVGDDMLSGYGFAEVIGKQGPFISQRVRAGIGVWGPGITYPPHRHVAEEVYIVMAGCAQFLRGEGDGAVWKWRDVGEVIFVRSLLTHGFRTGDDPLVVFYIWQQGDMRETSTFS